MSLANRRVLLVITGGIAAYKSLDLIRRLRERGASVRAILTDAATRFVTPLSVQTLTGDRVYSDIFSLTDESEMGHLRLAQDADLVVVAPATADMLAKMAGGIADDLASTALARDRPADPGRAGDEPSHVAARRDARQHGAARGARRQAHRPQFRRARRGRDRAGPHGRAAWKSSPPSRRCCRRVRSRAAAPSSPRGPTHEAIDPVRYLANRSSGKQGHAIAAALARAGAETVLVSGPTAEPDPRRRHGASHRIRARHDESVRGRAAGRDRGVRRGGRRLARRGGRRRSSRRTARRRR